MRSKPIDPEPIERVGIFPPRVWYTAANGHDNCHTDSTGAHCDCYSDTTYHADLAAFLEANPSADAGPYSGADTAPDTGSDL